MPSRRTIACVECGFLVRKRDINCERCGADTPQEKRRLKVGLISLAVMAIVLAGGWSYLKHTIAALAH